LCLNSIFIPAMLHWATQNASYVHHKQNSHRVLR
jgi:hypothetical protein